MGVHTLLIFLLLSSSYSDDKVYSAQKCCEQYHSLDRFNKCVPSHHHWYYLGILDFGLPVCNFTVNFAEEGSSAYCIDNSFETNSFLAVKCDGWSEFEIPPVNYVRKCCPFSKSYDSSQQSCFGQSYERDWPNDFFNIFVARFSGAVDTNVGTQVCDEKYVLVDFLLHYSQVRREESEAIVLLLPDRVEMRFNPDEVCLDLTENYNKVVVRACVLAEKACIGRPCVRKCCEDGFGVLNGQCTPTNTSVPIWSLFDTPPAFRFGNICPQKTHPNLIHLNNYTFEKAVKSFHTFCIDSDVQHPGISYYLACFDDQSIPKNNSYERKMSTKSIAMSASSLFIFAAIFCLLTLKNDHDKGIMCFLISLFVGFMCLLALQNMNHFILQEYNSVCKILAYGSQLGILGAYLSLNITIFNNWLIFGKSRIHNLFIVYSLYVWVTASSCILLPLFLTNDEVIFILGPDIGEQYCNLQLPYLMHFTIPKSVIICLDILLLSLTGINSTRIKQKSVLNGKRYHAHKKMLTTNLQLFAVLFISWLFELLSFCAAPHSDRLPYLINSMLGIAVAAIILTKEIIGKQIKLYSAESKRSSSFYVLTS